MKYSEYAKLPGLTSTNLSRFYESQDHALMTLEPSPYLEQGKAFERLIEDRVKGTGLFKERFFECDVDGDMPKELPKWVEDGEDLESKFVYNKPKKNDDGPVRSKTHSTKHAYLDQCLLHPGKIPIGKKDSDMLGRAVNNMLRCEVLGHPFEEILKVAEFQKCVEWEREGIKKKALHDVFIQTDDINYIFDLKLYASFSNFRTALKSRLWVQDIHYHEGAETIHGPTEPMVFMVASKEEPWLAKPFPIEEKSRMLAEDAYWKLCQNFVKWNDAGRPPKGWLDAEYVKLWFNN